MLSGLMVIMRSDIVPGALFPDYELTDHTAKHETSSPERVHNKQCPPDGCLLDPVRCGLPARKRSLPAFICWMISSGVILSRRSLVRSAWVDTVPRLASTTP